MAAVSPSRAPLTHFTVWDAQKFRINRSIGHASSASLTQPVHTRRGRRARVERLPPGSVRSLSRLNRRRQPLLATLHWLLSSVFCATLREARLVSIASGFLLAPKKKPRGGVSSGLRLGNFVPSKITTGRPSLLWRRCHGTQERAPAEADACWAALCSRRFMGSTRPDRH
jgi:hypothetical protein